MTIFKKVLKKHSPGTWLAQVSIRVMSLELRVVSLSPMWGAEII